MPSIRGSLWPLPLAALLAVATATSIRPEWLVDRAAETCPANFAYCANSGLPGNFCCGKDTTCDVLAGNTTVLCCPKGQACESITPITCNITLQDAATNPDAVIKTTVLDGKLDACDSGCCPFGYSCVDSNCQKNKDQSQKPPAGAAPAATQQTSAKSTATGTATAAKSTGTTTSSATGQESGAHSTAVDGGGAPATTDEPGPNKSSSSGGAKNTAAVVGGVVGGLVGAVALVAGALCLRHRRRQQRGGSDGGQSQHSGQDPMRRRQSSSSSFGNIISAPIPHADYVNARVDFMAKAQSSSVATTPTLAQGRFPPSSSPYSGHYAPGAGGRDDELSSHHTSAEVGGLRSLTDNPLHWLGGGRSPRTPDSPMRSPRDRRSSESINIFADPRTVESSYNNSNSNKAGARRDTTWTSIQQHAETVPDTPVRQRAPR
ncbi:hypothetical protein GGR56DRAFT_183399 [Xylariaceae sp. FL0804]|nr:hypothetical protein GGR56DRAFT_183399 [Xylariaceae sp. FL0804]